MSKFSNYNKNNIAYSLFELIQYLIYFSEILYFSRKIFWAAFMFIMLILKIIDYYIKSTIKDVHLQQSRYFIIEYYVLTN